MKMAICGYPPLALQLTESLKNSGVECTHFVREFVSSHGEKNLQITTPPLLPVNFFDFRRMIDAGKIDGLIIAEESHFIKDTVKICKMYDIPNVGVMDLSFFSGLNEIRYLDSDKAFMPQLEVNVIDSCNLNCKACAHYSNIFDDSDIYQIEDFTRDIKRIADNVDILTFYILGGEPLKLKNLDAYLKITKRFLPNTNLRLITNGLLIPKISQNILDSIRENDFKVEISMYPPTVKIRAEIAAVLEKNDIPYLMRPEVKTFNAFLTLHGGHNPVKARAACANNICRFLRNGKIYKCPVDALSFKFTERFGIKNFPAATGIDIFAKNFCAQIEMLDGNVELCTWCNETARLVDWTPENNPKITDWLADPAEIENFLPKVNSARKIIVKKDSSLFSD